MKVRVTPFRDHGRKLSSAEISSATPIVGELVSIKIAKPKGFYTVADLYEPLGVGLKNRLATLFEPELIQISDNCLFLRGIEKLDGRAFLQEWRCELS